MYQTVLEQLNLPPEYSAEMLKDDLLLFLEKERDYMEVSIYFLMTCNTVHNVQLILVKCEVVTSIA